MASPAPDPRVCEKCGDQLARDDAETGYLRCDDCDPDAVHLSATFPDGPGPCVACDPEARIAAVAEVAPEFVKPVPATDPPRRAAAANLRTVLTYLTSEAVAPAQLAQRYAIALDEFTAEDLRFAAATLAALAALKEQQ